MGLPPLGKTARRWSWPERGRHHCQSRLPAQGCSGRCRCGGGRRPEIHLRHRRLWFRKPLRGLGRHAHEVTGGHQQQQRADHHRNRLQSREPRRGASSLRVRRRMRRTPGRPLGRRRQTRSGRARDAATRARARDRGKRNDEACTAGDPPAAPPWCGSRGLPDGRRDIRAGGTRWSSDRPVRDPGRRTR